MTTATKRRRVGEMENSPACEDGAAAFGGKRRGEGVVGEAAECAEA